MRGLSKCRTTKENRFPVQVSSTSRLLGRTPLWPFPVWIGQNSFSIIAVPTHRTRYVKGSDSSREELHTSANNGDFEIVSPMHKHVGLQTCISCNAKILGSPLGEESPRQWRTFSLQCATHAATRLTHTGVHKLN